MARLKSRSTKASLHIAGVQRLMSKMDELSDELSGRILAEATEAGAEIVRDEARRRAPRDTGKLASSIESHEAKRRKRGRAGEGPGGMVSTRTRARAVWEVGPSKDVFYAVPLEFGHDIVRTVGSRKGRGSSRNRMVKDKQVIGHVPPKPFLRPALYGKKWQVVDVMRARFRAAIERLAGRG